MKSNDLVVSSDATEAAVYNNVYKGNKSQDYFESYKLMQDFVDQSLDEVKSELRKVQFPIFVCLFLNMMLKKQFKADALQFFQSGRRQFENEFNSEINVLGTVYDVSRLEDPEVSKFLHRKFYVKMSRQAYTLLKYYVDFNQLYLVMHIMNLNIQFEISSEQDVVKVSSVLVADGQTFEELNLGRIKEFYPESWEKATPAEDEAPKKKKNLNLISPEIPLPMLDKELQEHIQSEFSQQVKLSSNSLPSIGTIALTHAYGQVNCAVLSDSGEIMVCGLADSTVKVFWLNEAKVREHVGLINGNRYVGTYGMKVQLISEMLAGRGTSLQKTRQNLFKQSLERGVLDLRPDMEESKVVREMQECILTGHQGPVFCCSVSIDDKHLISGSMDCTVRRWSLQTRSCLVVYYGHQLPVWDVKFCSLGYYFASASNDRTACVWNMKQHQPVRILSGHVSDVTCVEFHPNIHYCATAGSDKQIRLWQIDSGVAVRMMFTVEGTVRSLKFTRAGTHCLAGNDNGQVVIFDINLGYAVDIVQTCQQRAIWSIDVSWDDCLISVATEIGSIELYSLKILLKQTKKSEEVKLPKNKNAIQKSPSPAFLKCYHTKMNGVMFAQFSWRNFLTSIGCIEKKFN